MSFVLLSVTAGVILAATVVAYARSRDVLHPLVYLGPMLFYQYVFSPRSLLTHGQLDAFFPDLSVLDTVFVLNLLGISLFCIGCVQGAHWIPPTQRLMSRQMLLSPVSRQHVMKAALVLGITALACYNYMVYLGGGYLQVYSRAKAYVSAGSGYIGDAMYLAYPAVILLAIAWQGRRLRLRHYAVAFLLISPNLIHGFLGARRGPLFMSLATLGLAWHLVRLRRPTLRILVVGLLSIALMVFFVKSHRRIIYLGSDFQFDTGRIVAEIGRGRGDVNSGEDFVATAGAVLMCSDTGRHYWGKRFFATYFVRPIPRQLWPTKYADLGMAEVMNQNHFMGFTDAEWTERLGWVPQRGAATGFIADLFTEFSWASLLFCFLLGRFYGYLWEKANSGSGLWALLYLQAAALSIYVPTQSISAVLQRFLFIAIPTVLLWSLLVGPRLQRRFTQQGDISPGDRSFAQVALCRRSYNLLPKQSQ